MDMQMPEMDGYTATAAIRGRSALRDAADHRHDRARDDGRPRESAAAGMNDHVTKPIDPDHLFATLAKWIAAARTGASARRTALQAARGDIDARGSGGSRRHRQPPRRFRRRWTGSSSQRGSGGWGQSEPLPQAAQGFRHALRRPRARASTGARRRRLRVGAEPRARVKGLAGKPRGQPPAGGRRDDGEAGQGRGRGPSPPVRSDAVRRRWRSSNRSSSGRCGRRVR